MPQYRPQASYNALQFGNVTETIADEIENYLEEASEPVPEAVT